jgi:hypothetical protein
VRTRALENEGGVAVHVVWAPPTQEGSLDRGNNIARRGVTGPHTHAWEWQARACVASRLPRAGKAWCKEKKHHPVRGPRRAPKKQPCVATDERSRGAALSTEELFSSLYIEPERLRALGEVAASLSSAPCEFGSEHMRLN